MDTVKTPMRDVEGGHPRRLQSPLVQLSMSSVGRRTEPRVSNSEMRSFEP